MKNKLALNTLSSLIYQITAVLCGFVVPKLILVAYGSEVNGLVNSINQFLEIVGFLDLGVGAVIQSALYKPLVEKNKTDLSLVAKSGNNYFRNIARVLLVYVVILAIVLPSTIGSSFDAIYIVSLILAIAISYFAQYYFGVVNGILVTADQKGYLKYNVQTVTLIINTLSCVILLKLQAPIQIVKLSTSLIYLVRPLYLYFYVNRNYDLDRKIKIEKEPIEQKRNGFAQHLAAFITGSTDTIVLTMFAGLKDVSIYSVYFLVINGLKQLLEVSTNGVQAFFGNLWAEGNTSELKKYFLWVVWLMHFIVTVVFGATMFLIIPFVLLYTDGTNDANYYVPAFSVCITIAYWIYCLKIPYNMMILVSGHYKETQHCFIITALINIVLSIVLVKEWGLVGVALGTLFALLYQTIWLLRYCVTVLVHIKKSIIIKQMLNSLLISGISILLCLGINRTCIDVLAWVLLAIKVTLIWGTVAVIVNTLLFREYINKIVSVLFGRFLRRNRSI